MNTDIRVRVLLEVDVHDFWKAKVMPARELEVEHHDFVAVLLQLERKMAPDESGTPGQDELAHARKLLLHTDTIASLRLLEHFEVFPEHFILAPDVRERVDELHLPNHHRLTTVKPRTVRNPTVPEIHGGDDRIDPEGVHLLA